MCHSFSSPPCSYYAGSSVACLLKWVQLLSRLASLKLITHLQIKEKILYAQRVKYCCHSSLKFIFFHLNVFSLFAFLLLCPSHFFCFLPALSSAVEPFFVQNRSLDYLRGTLGFSYMCREEQTLIVDPKLSINTFQVQVQPFNLTGDQFGAGKHFCLVACNKICLFLSRSKLSSLLILHFQLRNASWMKMTC